ncbi:hypothetical protein [Microbacterium schleiferi]|nr:hypothetical protein [Microbacterium schleiferi]MCC4267515.1 hypothetical protein [Microbacterium schleiferi]
MLAIRAIAGSPLVSTGRRSENDHQPADDDEQAMAADQVAEPVQGK